MIDLKKYKVHFLLSLAIAICFSSLIIADGRYYIDDYGRSISGYAAWTMNGRPLAEMFMITLNFGMPLPDLFPIPQVIAVIAFAIAMTIFSYKTSKEHVYCAVIAAAFIIASPTIISNLSYRYDSATMALSVLAATASSLLWYDRCIKNAVISFIVLLATLCLYQPSSNIFVLLSFYSYLISEDDRRVTFINLMVKGIVFILANAFYFITIVPMTISDDYNTTGSQLPEFHSVVDVIIRNTIAFSNIILDCLSHSGFVIVSLIALISTASLVMHIYKEHMNETYSVIQSMIRILFIPFAAFMIVGSMVLLKNPVFHPRVLVSSGFALAVIVGICINSSSAFRGFAIALSIALLVYLIGLFASFSNTQKAQENYESWIIQSIADDLASSQNVKNLIIAGSPGYAPVSRISIEKYPIIKRTIRILINGSDPWGMYQLRHFGINIKYPSTETRKEVLESYCQSEKKYRPTYDFSVYRDIAVVDFTKSCK
ncbi:glucosyltransferase domain-containing protein [Enterobacter cloacae]|uniref:glucosyltransferase domain-containing protein n=1 Tax=Enterobacter cloacae TaxID=550 RepID=UPI002075E234|nr:glucosyltransferase domain-containing protein [Enterobacter cloacae]MCM7137158.1 glucosyltransferase domain-containing protein [Enterobacter cloacae]